MSIYLLRPDNHELFVHVRLMAIARNPVISWEDIARNVGLDATDVPELLAWCLAYRSPEASAPAARRPRRRSLMAYHAGATL